MFPTGIADPVSPISSSPWFLSNNNLYLRKLLRAAAILFGVLVMLAAEHPLDAQALYQAPATFSVGTTPQGVVAADFWHTGYLGLVVANSGSNTMTVYPGAANATFATPTTISTCPAPGQVITADFNNDGYPDVAVACTGASEVEVFLNNQTGGFGTGTTIAVAAAPAALVAGDFNSDGYADLAVACGASGTATILLTNGAPISTGRSTTSSSSPGSNFTSIAAGKFDTSGHLSIALVDAANSILIIGVGNGAGTFSPVGSVPVQSGADSIVAGDWDHNGTTDLAVVNSTIGTISIFLGSGNDTFPTGNVMALVLPHANIGAVSIAALDINGDGNLDLVADSVATNSLYLVLGNGDGTFQASQQIQGDGNDTDEPTQQYPVAGGPAYLAVGDFNRDGKPDIAVTEQNGGAVALLLNNTLPTPEPGADSFGAPAVATNMNGNMADSIAVADFNHDGYPDTAVAYLEDNVVRVLLHGNTGAVASYAVGSQPYDVVSGDLNGDGYADLVTANTGAGTVSVLLNNGGSGNGTFAAASTYSVGHDPFQVAIGDLNGDGIPDLAVTNNGDNTVSILYGASGGTFTAGPTLTTGSQPYGVAIGRFGTSAANDIAVTCYASSQLYLFPNNGSGTFGSPNIYSTDSNPGGIVVGDFNRDGKPDIVTGNTIANDISFFAGNGDGTFQPSVTSGAFNFPNSIAAGDMNGDGILDVVTNASNFSDVAVLLGKGDGTFQPRADFPAGSHPWAVALADSNHDGKLDIFTANVYNTVDLATVSGQQQYETEYPPVGGGEPSNDLILNFSGTQNTLGESPNSYSPLAYNTATTLTATIASPLGGTTPTGSVIFEERSGLVLGTAPSVLSSGTATLTMPNLGSGLHVFTALYSGDANYQPNNSVANPGYLVYVAGTVVSLTLQSSTITAGSNLTYSVTVGTPGDGTTDPAGTVTLYAILPSGAAQALDSAQTVVGNGNGTASVSGSVNPGVAPGNYEVYAVFKKATGSKFATGSSSDEPLVVTGQPTSTTLSCVPETYFGFPTGEDECYSQVLANSTVLEQGTVDFAINGGSQNAEAIEDYTPNYYTPTLNGYYATFIFTAPGGSYPATSTFQLQQISGTYYSESSASGTF